MPYDSIALRHQLNALDPAHAVTPAAGRFSQASAVDRRSHHDHPLSGHH
jgi:hypothetical protein